jgi:NADH-quinone oxidoreductase subunit J
MEAIIYISMVFLLFFCVMAVLSHSILKSAIYLAAASVALGVVMYVFGAVWAAVFEVSVCSGLVTVIFISAISLSKMKKDEIHKLYEDKKRMALLPIILVISGMILVGVAYAKNFTLPSAVTAIPENFQEIFWNSRQVDILGQIVAILAGGIAVVVLFREDEVKK